VPRTEVRINERRKGLPTFRDTSQAAANVRPLKRP
jgi:hypothetical protein